jgi:hypothetical protein
MATVYKKTTYKEIQNRNVQPVDEQTNNTINSTISNFVTHFKAKHLG